MRIRGKNNSACVYDYIQVGILFELTNKVNYKEAPLLIRKTKQLWLWSVNLLIS